MIVECSAPGKAVLIGEYAVLLGHPALVMAVDRRARVRLAPAADGRSTVSAPGLVEGPQELALSGDGAVRWRDPSGRLPLVEDLLGALSRSGLVAAPLAPVAAELDTQALFAEGRGGRHKLGLGSSAALTVALASALLAWSGVRPPKRRLEWLRTLVRLHRDVHGGRGSGIDVAAALLGGVVSYRLGERGGVVEAAPVALPPALSLTFAWTGRSADTADFLGHLERRLGGGGGKVEGALARLGTISGAATEALRSAAIGHLLEAVDAFWEGLDELGQAADLDILSEEHRRLRRITREEGAAYKPSGAGGGDLGIAFSGDPERAGALARAIRRAGFSVIELAVDPGGCKLATPG